MAISKRAGRIQKGHLLFPRGSAVNDPSPWPGRLLSLLRIITAFLFMQHGAMKLFGFLAPPQSATSQLFSLMGLAGILEFFGGLAVLMGLFTRPVAFVLSGMMAVAYFMVHARMGFWPVQNKGELAVLYCFVFLYFSVAGGGVWSLDYLLQRRQHGRVPEGTERTD